jgi:hypothetical protein
MAAKGKVTFPQRGYIRGRLNEEVTVHGVKRRDGMRLYEVEFEDGIRAEWLPGAVELRGPAEEAHD